MEKGCGKPQPFFVVLVAEGYLTLRQDLLVARIPWFTIHFVPPDVPPEGVSCPDPWPSNALEGDHGNFG